MDDLHAGGPPDEQHHPVQPGRTRALNPMPPVPSYQAESPFPPFLMWAWWSRLSLTVALAALALTSGFIADQSTRLGAFGPGRLAFSGFTGETARLLDEWARPAPPEGPGLAHVFRALRRHLHGEPKLLNPFYDSRRDAVKRHLRADFVFAVFAAAFLALAAAWASEVRSRAPTAVDVPRPMWRRVGAVAAVCALVGVAADWTENALLWRLVSLAEVDGGAAAARGGVDEAVAIVAVVKLALFLVPLLVLAAAAIDRGRRGVTGQLAQPSSKRSDDRKVSR
ncbi:MAG TPA: hypothetical protein VK610_07610, partial [Rhodothermales bacterium]|nr:hypothetical protein [Rhodothermales bacterium]